MQPGVKPGQAARHPAAPSPRPRGCDCGGPALRPTLACQREPSRPESAGRSAVRCPLASTDLGFLQRFL